MSGAESSRAKAPEDYVWVPVHPWQADEILGTLYAAELATGVVIDLGESPTPTGRTRPSGPWPT